MDIEKIKVGDVIHDIRDAGALREIAGKGLSTNDYTDADKSKLEGIEADAQKNKIESIKVNGSDVTPDTNKAVNVIVPTKMSDLNLDGGDMASGASLRFKNASSSMVIQPFGIVKESNDQSHLISFPDKQGTVALTSDIPDVSGKQDTIQDLSEIRSGAALGSTAYQKPSAGIPASDMTTAVQNSLELANSSVQAEPIGSIIPVVDPSEFATKEEVSQLVDDLEDRVTDLEGAFDIVPSINLFDKSQALNNGYINSSGGISPGSAYKYSYAIPVIPGHYYLLSGRNLPTAKGVRCLDSNNSPLKVLIASTGNQYYDYSLPKEDGSGATYNGQFLAPAGAVSFQFNAVWNNDGDVNSVMLIDLGATYSANQPVPEYTDFGNIVTLKESALPDTLIAGLNGKVDKILVREVREEVQSDKTILNSYIKGYGNGDIATLNNFKVFRFPIVGGQRYSLTGLKASSDSIGFAIFHTAGGDDNTNKIAGSYYSSYGSDKPAVDREVTSPDNAAYLYIQRGNTPDAVTPKCIHISSVIVDAEESILSIGDPAQLGGTIVDTILGQEQDTQDTNDIVMLNALSGGMKLISYANKHPFSWSFPKPIVSIKIDDLHPSVDLAVKIAEEIGIHAVLGAPASQLGVVVTGITTPSEKIGDTALDVCQYLCAEGGEIVEHSTGTFTDESQIKSFFIDQKSAFLKNGIILRGAAVANSFPSDALKDKLEPYLRFYYDYSNGYGKEIPYNTSGNLVRSHTYGTSGFTTPAEVLAVVDTWKTFQEKGWNTITFHAVGGESSGGYSITEADYRTILTGIKERENNGDFYIMIWSEVYDTYGMYN